MDKTQNYRGAGGGDDNVVVYAASVPATTKNSNSKTRKAVAAASIGNALEWYDFSVFAFFASYIGHSFFVDGNEVSALISTFLVFAVGFIARPIGALYLGSYGDRV